MAHLYLKRIRCLNICTFLMMAIKFKTGNKFWNNLKGQFTLTEGKNRLSVLTEEVSDKNEGNKRIIAMKAAS